MPNYLSLNQIACADRGRIIPALTRLRKKLSREIPPRDLQDHLLLATWNLRDFDSNRYRHGPRLEESFHYIAEVISRFDIIALQEIGEDLGPLRRVMNLLGPWWDFITTDVTEGPGGNRERGTILFDKRKVRFDNVAGEGVLPKRTLIAGERQFARTPYAVSFRAGWFSFSLCTVHLYYGADSGEKMQRRIEEIDTLAKFMARRVKRENSNVILLGDFNIVSPQHRTMQALLDSGFHVPDNLRKPTNAMKNRYYDQIAFMIRRGELQPGTYSEFENSGVFDVFRAVYRPSECAVYQQVCEADGRDLSKWLKKSDGTARSESERKSYFVKDWRTFQISDHLPLWCSLRINFSENYLKTLRPN